MDLNHELKPPARLPDSFHFQPPPPPCASDALCAVRRQVMAARDPSTNVVFSPMSVGTALAMLFAGSRGRTAEQLWAALHMHGEKRDMMHSHRRLVRHTRVRQAVRSPSGHWS